jgi:hypothetical protein
MVHPAGDVAREWCEAARISAMGVDRRTAVRDTLGWASILSVAADVVSNGADRRGRSRNRKAEALGYAFKLLESAVFNTVIL